MALETFAPALAPALVTGLTQKALDLGTKALGAGVLWIVGRFVIRSVKRALERSLRARSVEATLVAYAESVTSVLLNILLVAIILGFVGVETTTFAGLLAAAGLAVGTAWSGLLANFAAGAFLVVLRPFRRGDFVRVAGGVTGTVAEVGMFVTAVDTLENVRTLVGNAKVFGDTIENFTTNPFRRVDRLAQLAHDADVRAAMAAVRARVAALPHVLATPPVEVRVLDFTLAGPVLAVRPYCHNDHYWDVTFATNEAIRDALGDAGAPVPATHHTVRRVGGAAS